MWVKPLIWMNNQTMVVRFSADPAGNYELPQLLGFDLEMYLQKYIRYHATTEQMRTVEADAQLFIQEAIFRKDLYFDSYRNTWRYLL